ncbi:MAG: transcription antitermination factor NusB [Gammaproteobacteria bacterium]|nr:transcription antitermination factor NusB [Gammaproteobacteria bacterium]
MARGRRGARRLALQALYQHQLAGHGVDELLSQFAGRNEYRGIDTAYFAQLLGEILPASAELDSLISGAADRSAAQLDPVERGILWIGVMELQAHADVPSRVVIDEAIELTHEFGAQDGFRFVNAVLDTLADRLRQAERN